MGVAVADRDIVLGCDTLCRLWVCKKIARSISTKVNADVRSNMPLSGDQRPKLLQISFDTLI